MEAPEKIYINGFSTFVTVPVKEGVEYTRTDAFIEKACDFIKTNIDHYIGHYLNDDDTYLDDSFIEDFKKYMEDSDGAPLNGNLNIMAPSLCQHRNDSLASSWTRASCDEPLYNGSQYHHTLHGN